MKNNQTKIAAALLLVAGSIIPAYGQGRGHDRDYGRDDRRGYQNQNYREDNRRNDYRGNGNDYRNGYRNDYRNSYRNDYRRDYDSRSWTPAPAPRYDYRRNFIPRERFYSYFGPRHFFRIGRPAYYNGYPRFAYGGYNFRFMEPVPAYWGNSWYDSDDVYIDGDGDDYYMYNRRYPGVGISISLDF
jgi:hypothetical protein